MSEIFISSMVSLGTGQCLTSGIPRQQSVRLSILIEATFGKYRGDARYCNLEAAFSFSLALGCQPFPPTTQAHCQKVKQTSKQIFMPRQEGTYQVVSVAGSLLVAVVFKSPTSHGIR